MAIDRGRARGVLARAGLTLTGLVGVAGVVATVGYGEVIALPADPAAFAAVRDIDIDPAAQLWVCPGPATLTDAQPGGDPQFDPTAGATSTASAAFVARGSARLGPLGEVGSAVVGGPDATVTVRGDVTGPTVLTVTPAVGATATAAVGSLTPDGDLRGLAAATCLRPAADHWLVGGGTELGESTQLIVHNPGQTPATVTVELWGPGGRSMLGSGAQQLLAPGATAVTLVEAAAPDERRIAVRVSATGGLVTAHLQHNMLRGLVPLGVDFVVPGAPPATVAIVAGVASQGEPVEDKHAPRLRLLAPGDSAATARLEFLGPEGSVTLPGAEKITLGAGVVTDVSLGGSARGSTPWSPRPINRSSPRGT